MYLAATKQLFEWFSPSVRLSVRPSVRLSVKPFSLCSHHRIIMKFTAVITIDRSDVDARGQGHRSKVKVTEVQTILPQFDFFRSVTPVWKSQISMKLCTKFEVEKKRWPIVFQSHLSIIKVTPDNKLLILTRIERFCAVTWVWFHRCLWNDKPSLKKHRRDALMFSRSSVKFQGHMGQIMLIFTRISCFRMVTPICIYWWLWNDA